MELRRQESLRFMARNGERPSAMLRMLMAELELPVVDGMVDRNPLVEHFSEAFCFSDGEAYAIFGWFPGGGGELKDENIDYLLTSRIEKTTSEWDQELTWPS